MDEFYLITYKAKGVFETLKVESKQDCINECLRLVNHVKVKPEMICKVVIGFTTQSINEVELLFKDFTFSVVEKEMNNVTNNDDRKGYTF